MLVDVPVVRDSMPALRLSMAPCVGDTLCTGDESYD